MGLGRTEVKHAVHFGEGLGDQQTGPEQVAATPPEGDRLTPPEAAIHKDHDEEIPWRGRGCEQTLDLVGGQVVGLGLGQ